MWTSQNRGRYDRSKLRYPSDVTDDEWKLVEPLIPRQALMRTAWCSSTRPEPRPRWCAPTAAVAAASV